MREGLARDCTGGMEMKEWGGCERGDGGAGGGQQQQCKARERGQQPAVFYKLPFKRNQQRDGGGGREGSSGSRRWIVQGCTHLAAVASRLRRPTHKKNKNKTSGISFDTGAGSNKCGAMGTSKAPPPIDASSKSALFQLFTSFNPCVCRKKRKTTPAGCCVHQGPRLTSQQHKHKNNV